MIEELKEWIRLEIQAPAEARLKKAKAGYDEGVNVGLALGASIIVKKIQGLEKKRDCNLSGL